MTANPFPRLFDSLYKAVVEAFAESKATESAARGHAGQLAKLLRVAVERPAADQTSWVLTCHPPLEDETAERISIGAARALDLMPRHHQMVEDDEPVLRSLNVAVRDLLNAMKDQPKELLTLEQADLRHHLQTTSEIHSPTDSKITHANLTI